MSPVAETLHGCLCARLHLDQRVLYTFRPSGTKEVFSMRILDTFRPAGANVRGAMNCATTNAFFP